jgi:hypothetical protein
MLEYAREDAKTDMDLHDVTERAIELMKSHDWLCMDNYDSLVGGETTNEAVWDEPNPKKHHEKLSPSWKAKAKARASAAGRPYPNAVDNIWAAKQQK